MKMTMATYNFKGKRVLVTGTSGGLGSAITQRVVQMVARGSGRIINIVSRAGRTPVPSVGIFGRSKSALAALLWPRMLAGRIRELRDKVVRGQAPKARRWRLLQVESSLACNLKCIMCPWREISKSAGKQAHMSETVWAAIRPHLPQITSVDFTGGGEPLLQPNLITWVAQAHRAGCETGILTNGLLLSPDKAHQLIDAGIDWICVSIDGATADVYEKIRQGSNFEKVCANLSHVCQLRGATHPKIMINFVIMTVNAHQMEEMVMLARQLGVDQINFKQCDVIRGDHGKNLGLFSSRPQDATKQFQHNLTRARKLAKKHGITTTAFAFAPNELPVCEQDPRNSMFVRYDGAVAPCINLAIGGPTTFLGRDVRMADVHYGRLPGADLLQLWDTKLCNFFRQRFSSRKTAYDNIYMAGLMKATSNLDRLNQGAIEAMPEAPKGCRICHYLYGI